MRNQENTILEILGTKVERFTTDLAKVAQSQGYSITTEDIQLPPDRKKPDIYNWMHFFAGIKSAGTFTLNLGQRKISTIGAIMQAKDKKKRQNDYDYFGLTTAHSFLDKKQNGALANSTREALEISQKVAGDFLENDYYVGVAPAMNAVDISGAPRILYRYWKAQNVLISDLWAVMQDISFFELKERQIYAQGLLESSNISANQDHDTAVKHAHIAEISSKESLDSYIGKRVTCCGKKGKIVESPYITDLSYQMGLHLAFVLDDNEL